MKKITNKQIEELAHEALLRGNPYINGAIRYNVDGETRYLYAGESMTRENIDRAYIETASKDIRNGYNERGVGYYDKWYRYSRADNGRAYDFGQRLAAQTTGCSEEFHIIECIH